MRTGEANRKFRRHRLHSGRPSTEPSHKEACYGVRPIDTRSPPAITASLASLMRHRGDMRSLPEGGARGETAFGIINYCWCVVVVVIFIIFYCYNYILLLSSHIIII